MPRRVVLMISGSTRLSSTNSAACRTAALCAPDGVEVRTFLDLAALPHFNPDDDVEPVPAAVARLRAAIEGSDAVLFCTPEYAGTLPGSFKNLLDWTVGSTVLTDKPVAELRVAADPRRGAGAHDTLLTVLGYVQARIVHGPGWHVPVARTDVGIDATIADTDIRAALREMIRAVLA